MLLIIGQPYLGTNDKLTMQQMSNPAILQVKMEALHTCVIIPTYNNACTLGTVIEGVLTYTTHIIVVDDGSTDQTKSILASFPLIRIIDYKKNRGKGWALRQGFALARELGYHYAITIDSDGQHAAGDLPLFMAKLETVKDAIIIGARNMDQASVPGKSSFGKKFSNFWFKLETGITTPDTQSGYRLYPLILLKDTGFVTRKYEFEIEVLVRAAWNGIIIESIPVSVYYPSANDRVSHFRPFTDFTRISILNSILVLIAIFYIRPRNFFRTLFNKEKSRQFILDNLFSVNQSDQVKAISVGFGVFMGIIPIWGFQLLAAIFLALVLKLNKPLVIIAANISIPPMIPLIIYGSYKTGAYWMGAQKNNIPFSWNISRESVRNNVEQYIYGSITLAVVAGTVIAILTFLLLKIFKGKTAGPGQIS